MPIPDELLLEFGVPSESEPRTRYYRPLKAAMRTLASYGLTATLLTAVSLATLQLIGMRERLSEALVMHNANALAQLLDGLTFALNATALQEGVSATLDLSAAAADAAAMLNDLVQQGVVQLVNSTDAAVGHSAEALTSVLDSLEVDEAFSTVHHHVEATHVVDMLQVGALSLSSCHPRHPSPTFH